MSRSSANNECSLLRAAAGLLAAASALCACGGVSDTHVDARPASSDASESSDASDACVPESDQAFCARQASGHACEQHAGLDNCGAQRQADCGACATGMGCVVGTCQTPVCTSFDYTVTALPAFTRANIQDAIAAATPDGQVVVILQTPTGATCGGLHLIIADEVAPGSGTYMHQDATTVLQNLQLYTGREGHAITADGLTLIARSADSKRWLASKRSATQAIDFATGSDTDFAQINAQIAGTGATFRAPVISADGLEFVYKIESSDPAQRGIYIAVRDTASVPFPAGAKQSSPVGDYEFPTGISSDRLTLFMFDNFTGRVLTRTSTSQRFVNPNAPAAPPQISAWQHKPLADCKKLVAMSSPGGCANEDVVLLTHP
jgi:hypothetical protein